MVDVITKQHSDITATINIRQLPLGATIAPVTILSEGSDTNVAYKLYYDLDDIATDLGESSGVYIKADALYSVTGFNGPIGVLTYPNADGQVILSEPEIDVQNIKATPTDTGIHVTADATKTQTVTAPGVVVGLNKYLWKSGSRYFIFDHDKDLDLAKTVAKYLYDNQHGILVATFDDVDDAEALTAYAKTLVKDNHMGNTFGIFNQNEDQYPDATTAAFASQRMPLDWKHIRNIDGITENDVDPIVWNRLKAANIATTVDMAGDTVLSTSRMVDGTFADNTVEVQYVYDSLMTGLQHWMNNRDSIPYDDDGIRQLVEQGKSTMQEIAKQHIFENDAAGNPICDCTGVARKDISNAEVIKRHYDHVTASCQLIGQIETIDLTINITL